MGLSQNFFSEGEVRQHPFSKRGAINQSYDTRTLVSLFFFCFRDPEGVVPKKNLSPSGLKNQTYVTLGGLGVSLFFLCRRTGGLFRRRDKLKSPKIKKKILNPVHLFKNKSVLRHRKKPKG